MKTDKNQRILYLGIAGLTACTLFFSIEGYQVKEEYEAQVKVNRLYIDDLNERKETVMNQEQVIKKLEASSTEKEEALTKTKEEKDKLAKDKKELEKSVLELEQSLKIKREKQAEAVLAEKEEQQVTLTKTEPEETAEVEPIETAPASEVQAEKTTSPDTESKTSAGNFDITFYSAYDGTQSGVTAGGTDMAGGNITTDDGYTIVAVDTSVIPLGTKLKVTLDNGTVIHGKADDTGGAIQGTKIDIATPSASGAMSKGRTTAKVEILN